jgi:hypothetical protein
VATKEINDIKKRMANLTSPRGRLALLALKTAVTKQMWAALELDNVTLTGSLNENGRKVHLSNLKPGITSGL